MAKKAAAEAETVKTPAGLKTSLQSSPELAAVIGPEPLARTEAVSKIWAYIKAHDLQNPQNRREIVADEKLRLVFRTDKVTMFEMNKHLARHLAAR
jgi:upstream activation factor subunit UAF30